METTRGRVEAAQVVVTTNGYTGRATPSLARRLVAIPSFLIATEDLGEARVRELIPNGRMIVETRDKHLYYRPSPDGRRIVIGGRAALHPIALDRAAAWLMKELRDIFPSLATTHVSHVWTGNVAMTRSDLPGHRATRRRLVRARLQRLRRRAHAVSRPQGGVEGPGAARWADGVRRHSVHRRALLQRQRMVPAAHDVVVSRARCDPLTSTDFPAGLPARLQGPGAWYGPELAMRGGWVEPLSAAELDELAAAAEPWLARAERDARALNDLQRADFPLPLLSSRVARMTEELLHGRGFVLLRGVPVERWGNRLSAVAFYGLGVHIGSPRTQNAQGHLLGHVRDLGLRSDDPNVRIYQTHERQTFHTDSADIVGCCACRRRSPAASRRSFPRSRSTTSSARAGPTSRAGCSRRSPPIAGAKCLPAKGRTSRFPCSTGTRVRCRRSISASTSIRPSASPTRLA